MLLTLCLIFTAFVGIQVPTFAAEGEIGIYDVDVTGKFKTPVIGNAIESTIIQGKGYTMEVDWDVVVFGDDGITQQVATGVFEEGKIYIPCGKLVASEGYYFPFW